MENDFGSRLREERSRLQLSQSAFADLAGVTKTTQGNYETNKRSPDATYLAAIARHGADVGYVVTGERTSDAGIGVDAVKLAVEKAFTMVSASDMAVTPVQLAAMVVAFLPAPLPTPSGAPGAQSSDTRIHGHGNMIASGSGITQVGGHTRIRTTRK
ncbi:helix-turn-helix transcriptional regulator [Pandoraea pnomenusa]|uniref:helix-turn-helix domain-containing protein n=1 Tax=Pandoraea pnomenusa TaxID=93220 RepID=UPI00333E9F12